MAVKSYYSLQGRIVGQRTVGSNRLDYLPDALGTVVGAIREATGSTDHTARYRPYGSDLASTGSDRPSFGWIGMLGYLRTARPYADHYVRARHYSSSLGRWLTVDPLWPFMSAYSYGSSAPTVNVDPSGLADYALGSVPMTFKREGGHGAWKSQPPHFLMQGDMESLKSDVWFSARTVLNKAGWIWTRKLLDHYFENTGRPYDLNLNAFVSQTRSGRKNLDLEYLEALKFVEAQNLIEKPGVHNIYSRKATTDEVKKSDSADWYYAIRGYNVWGSARVYTTPFRSVVTFTFCFFKEYNFDRNETATVGFTIPKTKKRIEVPLPFALFDDFHLMGLARNYDIVGALKGTTTYRRCSGSTLVDDYGPDLSLEKPRKKKVSYTYWTNTSGLMYQTKPCRYNA